MNPTGLDSAFTDLSNKIGFIQFGALNRSGLIFETGYRSVFEIKWKRLNSNNWAAREKLLGRPAKRSAPAGCLSGCPHSSVTRGWAKRYGATWVVRSDSNPTAGSHRGSETTPARTKPSAASGGCWGLTGVLARVGEAGLTSLIVPPSSRSTRSSSSPELRRSRPPLEKKGTVDFDHPRSCLDRP